MAELLVRKINKVNSDFYLNTKCFKAGDVISIQPDGGPWGNDDLNDTVNHTIIKLPKVSVSEASYLMTPEIDVDPKNPSKTLQRRAFHLDLTKPIFAGPSAAFANLTVSQLTPLSVQKVAVADPAVFGESANIF